jgi:putative aldouronate transport system permease protein
MAEQELAQGLNGAPGAQSRRPSRVNRPNFVDFIICAFLTLVCALMLYPMLRVIAMSVSEAKFIVSGAVGVLPKGFNLVGYSIIIGDPNFWNAYKNTIIYAVLGTAITLIVTALIAYPLSIPGFVLKKPVTIYLAITMFFSGGLIPTYIAIQKMGGINSLWVMIVPGCLSAYNTFVYRSFFQGIPASLRESATIDGANDLTVFFRIIVPLSKPLFATFALFSMVGHWNSWFSAMLYLRDQTKHPLQMILRRLIVDESSTDAIGSGDSKLMEMFAAQQITPQNIQMAAVIIVLIPILCIYPFLQKYFVKGVMIGSIKG